MTLPVVVGLTGASGAAYGVEAVRLLVEAGIEVHLVVTAAGQKVLALELGLSPEKLGGGRPRLWPVDDIAAPIASGSFRTAGMLVAPCSIRTLSAVACSTSSNLLERAADVTLKERRPLVLLVRETPLHRGHLRLMLQASEAGAVIMPPVPAFYAGLQSIGDLVEQTTARALDELGIDLGLVRRWTGAR
jgi:4-hydroxy-3-polyprenylbenzoate decarboxylase